jgi:hypothetical protein
MHATKHLIYYCIHVTIDGPTNIYLRPTIFVQSKVVSLRLHGKLLLSGLLLFDDAKLLVVCRSSEVLQSLPCLPYVYRAWDVSGKTMEMTTQPKQLLASCDVIKRDNTSYAASAMTTLHPWSEIQ